VIDSVDGDEVDNSSDALTRIAAKPPGTIVTVGGIHDGQKFSKQVTVAERPGAG